MPTPVSTARQCLTEEAARILDDAVAVARRRFHAQTTSLHAVYALLSLPSSLLRDACSRTRLPAYSSRLQFRALDLCIGVSLDRLQSSKSPYSDENPPPVSNSLFAAIKRSQASQRRQPEMIYQVGQYSTNSIYSISSIKVEIKVFVTSILDDPMVSRVLGDAGFRSTDIKLAILHPPASLSPVRYFRGVGGRSPPLFLCNLTRSRSSVDFNGNQSCTRIGEILAQSSGRNPLLVGFCAREALEKFKRRLMNRKGEGVLPSEIAGVELICAEMAIKEFVSHGGSKVAFESKLEELSSALDNQLGHGVVVSIGDFKVLVEAGDAVKLLMSKLSILLKIYKKKMWLIGAAVYATYDKFLDKFPSLEVDWDLHPLPIASTKSSAAESNNKSRLLSSFVPLGGFFSSPSDYGSPPCIINKPFTRCSTCNEKYKQELSTIKSVASSVSVPDDHSSTLPSWLQLGNSNSTRTHNVTTEITDEKAEPNAKVLWLQRKWDEICKGLHQLPDPVIPCTTAIQNTPETLNDELSSTIVSGVPVMLQNTSLQSNSHPQSSRNPNLSSDHASSSSTSSVTTDLGLGTPGSAPHELNSSKLILHKLTEKLPWQAEACYDIAQIISSHGERNSDTWIGLAGPDRVGKMKMAEALSESVFGAKQNMIAVDFSAAKRTSESHFVFDNRTPDDCRMNMVDYIAWELSRRTCLVFLLRNVNKINDPLTQRSLLNAIRKGKFLNSHGKEFSTGNAIFLIECNSTEDDQDVVSFAEHDILEALNWKMKIVATTSNKRKQNCSIEPLRQKKPKYFLDLNLPIQDSISENSRKWLREFIERVERKVKFKTVNFDPLANRVLQKMSLQTTGFRVEVNREVMSQILAAYLCSDGEGELDDWIREVFGKACGEAQGIYSPCEEISLKLVSCHGLAIDEHAPGIRLPRTVSLG